MVPIEQELIKFGGPMPADELLPLPELSPLLELPEHRGEELGDFAETIIDNVGEVKPELLDEPLDNEES